MARRPRAERRHRLWPLVLMLLILAATIAGAQRTEQGDDDDRANELSSARVDADADAAGANANADSTAPPSKASAWPPPPPLPCTREPALSAAVDLVRANPHAGEVASSSGPAGALAAAARRLVAAAVGGAGVGIGVGISGGGGGAQFGRGELRDVWRCPAAGHWWERAVAVWSPVTVTVSCPGRGSKFHTYTGHSRAELAQHALARRPSPVLWCGWAWLLGAGSSGSSSGSSNNGDADDADADPSCVFSSSPFDDTWVAARPVGRPYLGAASATAGGGCAMAATRALSARRVASALAGLALFAAAPGLAGSSAFRLTAGTLVFVSGSAAVLVFLVARAALPRRAGGAAVASALALGTATSGACAALRWAAWAAGRALPRTPADWLALLLSRPALAYAALASALGLCVTYWLDDPRSQKLRATVREGLRLAALASVCSSATSGAAGLALAGGMLAWAALRAVARRVPPPRRRESERRARMEEERGAAAAGGGGGRGGARAGGRQQQQQQQHRRRVSWGEDVGLEQDDEQEEEEERRYMTGRSEARGRQQNQRQQHELQTPPSAGGLGGRGLFGGLWRRQHTTPPGAAAGPSPARNPQALSPGGPAAPLSGEGRQRAQQQQQQQQRRGPDGDAGEEAGLWQWSRQQQQQHEPGGGGPGRGAGAAAAAAQQQQHPWVAAAAPAYLSPPLPSHDAPRQHHQPRDQPASASPPSRLDARWPRPPAVRPQSPLRPGGGLGRAAPAQPPPSPPPLQASPEPGPRNAFAALRQRLTATTATASTAAVPRQQQQHQHQHQHQHQRQQQQQGAPPHSPAAGQRRFAAADAPSSEEEYHDEGGRHGEDEDEDEGEFGGSRERVVVDLKRSPPSARRRAAPAPAAAVASSAAPAGARRAATPGSVVSVSPLVAAGQIWNPDSGRAIAIGKARYNELLEQGYVPDLQQGVLVPPPPPPSASPHSAGRRR